MSQPAVQCEGLSKSFGKVFAVQELSLTVEEGALVALVGPSGCGKTTALRLIAGFETPNSGSVSIRGRLMSSPDQVVPPERRRVGMVFQDYALFPHLTVRQNVEFGLPKGEERALRVDVVLELVGLAHISSRLPHQLSGGEQQRVALARALAPNPAVVLLDEPFSNLDAGLRARVRSEVKRILKDAGTSAIFVTHDQDEALSLADQLGVMVGGRVLQVGTPEDIYAHPNSLAVAEFVGEVNMIAGMASGPTVSTELGILRTRHAASGPVKVLVRPEAIHLHEVTQSHRGAILRVVDREFYGHDQVIQVQLPSGTVLRVRCGPEESLDAGALVDAIVHDPVPVFLA
jgi:iron(III) transport system ATP-binding protein